MPDETDTANTVNQYREAVSRTPSRLSTGVADEGMRTTTMAMKSEGARDGKRRGEERLRRGELMQEG